MSTAQNFTNINCNTRLWVVSVYQSIPIRLGSRRLVPIMFNYVRLCETARVAATRESYKGYNLSWFYEPRFYKDIPNYFKLSLSLSLPLYLFISIPLFFSVSVFSSLCMFLSLYRFYVSVYLYISISASLYLYLSTPVSVYLKFTMATTTLKYCIRWPNVKVQDKLGYF